MFHEGTDMMIGRGKKRGTKMAGRARSESAPHFPPPAKQEMIDVWIGPCRRRPHTLSMTSRGYLDPTID